MPNPRGLIIYRTVPELLERLLANRMLKYKSFDRLCTEKHVFERGVRVSHFPAMLENREVRCIR